MIGFKKKELLNSSSFSKIYLAEPDTGTPRDFMTRYLQGVQRPLPAQFVVKIVSGQDEHLFKRETKTLAALQQISPMHFVGLYDTALCVNTRKETPAVTLVMCLELADCDLYDARDKYDLSSMLVQRMTRDVASGLHIMHSAGLIHTDIKPENIFFIRSPGHPDTESALQEYGAGTGGHRFVIADFDTCQPMNESLNRRVGTSKFKAPELCMRLDYTPAIDIWSLGMVYFEALTGKSLIEKSEGDSMSGSLSASMSSCSSSDDELPTFIEEIAQMEFYFGSMPVGMQVSPVHYTGGAGCPNCSDAFEAAEDSCLKYPSFEGKSLLDRMKKIDNHAQHVAFVMWLAHMNPHLRPTADQVAALKIIQ
jgi:serine/threonine protein kinase